SRQAVQRVVHDLTAQGLVEPSGNPDHKRAPLITLTPEGEAAYGDAIKRQDDWASELAGKIDGEQARAALDTLKALSALCGATRRPALPQKAKGGAQ
ncbi:MarR family winged helix-turn-helix transcriptional regulator, partial [Henriciella sp.]